MKKIPFLELIAALGIAFSISCSEQADIKSEYLQNRINIIATVEEAYYYKIPTASGNTVPARIDSIRINNFKTGNYKLKWYPQKTDEGNRVYTIEEKIE